MAGEILPEVATARLMDDGLDMSTQERVSLAAAVYDELERLRAIEHRARELAAAYKVGPVGRAVRHILDE